MQDLKINDLNVPEPGEVLLDVRNGKEVDWKGHKELTIDLSASYERLGNQSKSTLVHQCGNFLEFHRYEDGERKLYRAYFCKVRLCPMCAWRRSLKIFGQTSRVMDYLQAKYDYRYLFLTLTARNVSGDDLSNEITVYLKAFNDMTKSKEFKAMSKGWFRCLEITHNIDRGDYHPHIHMIIAINKSYFTDTKSYISWDKWVALWRHCLRVDYDPVLRIEALKPDKNQINEDKPTFSKSIKEVSKYTAKSSDYIVRRNGELDIKETDKAVSVLDKALRYRRLTAYGGKFKEVHKLLNLDDVEDGDLIHTDNDDSLRADLKYVVERYKWMCGNYMAISN